MSVVFDAGAPASTARPPSWILALAIAPALAALGAWLVWIVAADPAVGMFSDSVDYLIMADFYRGMLGADREAAYYSVAHYGTSRFPPLFPLLLAGAGAGRLQPGIAYLVTAACALFACVAVGAWYLRQMRSTATTAALLAAATLGVSSTQLLLNPVSEPLYVALLATSFVVAARVRDGDVSPLLLGLVAGMVPLARMAGVAVAIAVVCWLFWGSGRRRRDCVPAALAAILPALLWMGYRSLLPVNEDYAAQLSLERMLEAFGGWQGLVVEQPLRQLDAVAANFALTATPLARGVALVTLALAAHGWWLRLWRQELDAYYLPLYLGICMVWPYPAESARLMAVAMPVVLLHAWWSAAWLGRVAAERRRASHVLPSALVATWILALAWPWAGIARRASLDADDELRPFRRSTSYFLASGAAEAEAAAEHWARLVGMARSLPEVIGRECVYTTFPSMVWLQSGGRARALLIPAPEALPQPPAALFDRCRYVLALNMESPQNDIPPLFPAELLADDAHAVLLSQTRVGGRDVTAAVLLERRPPVEASPARTRP